ncbi:hypothetical protein ACHAXR_002091 [Thalassiosira sp. AJA248-18]
MVDYSKWDRMDFSESDNDEEESSPRVTSLDQPGKVTIGSDGSLEIGKSSVPPQPRTHSLVASSQMSAQEIPTVSGSVGGDVVDISSRELNNKQKNSNARQWLSQLTHNGGKHQCTATTNQKEIKLPIYWSQDRHTITLRLGFPSATIPTRSVRTRVKGALKYADRFSAVGSGVMSGYKDDSSDNETSHGSVEIISLSNENQEEKILLTGKLPRPVHLNQDEDEIDFEIEDNLDEGASAGDCNCNKLVTIVMPKAVPMAGMVLWWDCPLVGYPQIDVSTIQERNLSKQTKGEGGVIQQTDEKKEAFQKAWDEAHTMFREKMKTKEKQSIDVDE